MFISDLADTAGRRPAYMACFLIYIGANIGLAVQNSYAALFVLRALQSAGSSGTVALCSGVVGDIATPDERGSYMGFVMAGTLLGPSLGPVIGGLLAEYLGWRAIFWFLLIFSVAWIVPFLLLFPETARKVVGNGSIPPPKRNMSLIGYLKARRMASEGGANPPCLSQITFPKPWRTLSIISHKHMGILLLANSIFFSGFYVLSASIPYIFQASYGFDALQIGLCFIPIGIGSSLASVINGKLLDYNYRRIARDLDFPVVKNRHTDLRNFPVEKARLQMAFPMLAAAASAMIAFGWCLEVTAPIAGLIVLLFFLGLSLTTAFNTIATLIIDLFPETAATAMAANNFGRCLFGAGSTAVLVPMLEAMGRGWFFTFIAFVMLSTVPMVFLLIRVGPRWREEQRSKQKAGDDETSRPGKG
jgi:multidrug resistance protein